MKRALRSLFAAGLATLFLCTPLSNGVVLADPTTEKITAASPTVTAQPSILREATDRRDETSKTFLRSDGSYVTYIYGTAVHEKDEKGVWQEVDNRLTKTEDGIATADGEITFAMDRPSVTMGEVSWTLTRNSKSSFAKATATNTDASAEYLAMSAEEKQTTAIKATSQVTYLDRSGNGVRYAISSGRIKEDIVLASPAAIDDYTVCFNAPGLTATLCEEGRSVTFTDAEGETVLTAEVPYMEDAAEEVSTAIDLSMTQSGSTVLLHIRPDRDWLTAADRVYPVVIDPVYYTSQTSGITDTMVHTGDSAGTCSSCGLTHRTYNKMYVGLKDGKRYYAYLSFAIESSLFQVDVTRATLVLHLPNGTSTGGPFRIDKVTSGWNQNDISFSNQPASSLLQTNVAYSSSSNTLSLDITSAVQQVASSGGVYGFKVGYANESINDYNSFWTSEYATVSYRPRIAIEYDAPYEGTFFIRNVGDGNYLEPVSTYARTRNFDGATNQRWVFSLQTNGYYTIRNADTGKYLGIENNATGTNVAAKMYDRDTTATGQEFRISTTPSGNLKISPRCGEANSRILGVSSSYAGQGDYTNNTNYQDEWVLENNMFSAEVNSLYDLGYCVRYGETAATSISNIDFYMNEIADRYRELLDLDLNLGETTYFYSDIDACKGTVSSSNIDNLCNHSGTCHTDRTAVISDFSSSYNGNSTTTYVLWTCHKIKSTATSGAVQYNRSCSSGTKVYMLAIHQTNRTNRSQGVLMHELNHQYGARDHYHELADSSNPDSCKFKNVCSECAENPRPKTCIMYSTANSIYNDDIICEGCTQEILSHLLQHHRKDEQS